MGNLNRLVSLGLSQVMGIEPYFTRTVCEILAETAGNYPLEQIYCSSK